ncbi:hypothetical protein BN946_scf184799.g19 [Trametes cinnabarina]|uniref:Uncharacterized protein n=1 Tax=Pycnoporus cinnabarinus TaxID=5643 RepID=A0A060S1T8_PYCCI|nr:hypothetical protein BN946_scf184799.g19 [Trametes cinnabarina]
MDLAAPFVLSRKQTVSFDAISHKHSKAHKEGNTKPSLQQSSLPDHDFAEKPQKDDDGDDEQKTSKSDAKDKNKKNKSQKSTEVNAAAVPAPAPDTGTTISAIHPGILPVIPSQVPTTLTIPANSLVTGLTTVTSLAAVATSHGSSSASAPTGSPTGNSKALSVDHANRTGAQSPKHLPVVLIVLVIVGLSFLLLGAFIVWRARRRPRERSCPTPSLPIFQDPFADEDWKMEEESLFGGKERASSVARPNSNGLWTWTQYTPKPSAQTLDVKPPLFNLVAPMPSTGAPVVHFSEKRAPPPPPPPAPVHVPLPVDRAPANPPLQQMQSALTRAANRVSALSMSIYPTSPQSTSGIGLALGGMSPLTADGTPVVQRKPSSNRLSKNHRSMRHSLAATEYLDMHADIYGGAQIASPFVANASPAPPSPSTMPKPALRKSTSISVQGQGQGRARVKAPYNPGLGGPLRSSSTVAGITTLARGNRSSIMAPSEEMQYVLPPLSPALKSETRRERDARALTSAMGLATPDVNALPPFSPQPTLYPDDSSNPRRGIASVPKRTRRKAREGWPTRGGKPDRVQSGAMSPGMEASARLGNLMLAEFTSMASLPSTRTVANAAGATSASGSLPASSSKSRVTRKNVRADDRPPRVPSPPPLPTLAQMAMAHANPQEYADYHSPTYSIYGLYEAERKSRMPSEAGF